MDTEQLLLALDGIADALELRILGGVQQLVQQLLIDIEGFLNAMPEGQLEAELAYRWTVRPAIEQAMIPLNDTLYQLTVNELVGATGAIRNALNNYELIIADPPIEFRRLAEQVKVLAIPLSELFRRRSPSPFMEMLLRVVDSKVRQAMMRPEPRGFGQLVFGRTGPNQRPNRRDRSTIQSGFRKVLRANTTAAIGSSIRFHTIEVFPDRSNVRWKWITRRDELVCPVCRPNDGVIYSSWDDVPPWPAHPMHCRCVVVPLFTD